MHTEGANPDDVTASAASHSALLWVLTGALPRAQGKRYRWFTRLATLNKTQWQRGAKALWHTLRDGGAMSLACYHRTPPGAEIDLLFLWFPQRIPVPKAVSGPFFAFQSLPGPRPWHHWAVDVAQTGCYLSLFERPNLSLTWELGGTRVSFPRTKQARMLESAQTLPVLYVLQVHLCKPSPALPAGHSRMGLDLSVLKASGSMKVRNTGL